ncbi:AsmA family protein [Hydrogenophaga pseudoflava]|uniref:AsmA family protein n=1 Tax=Hydrogenophaga pseudoflava TaxID=47421 RepID=UPI0027E444CD|nr:AsmA family protein [Hydrogenophaga pseudoflava]MDQ7744370.1 AsmA family protein [Hydrogenophaga pseudoflava]
MSTAPAGTHPPQPPRRPALRRVWLGLGAFVVLLVLGLVWGEATGWSALRGPLQRQIEKVARVPVQLEGRFHLRMLGAPRLEVGRIKVGAAQEVPAPHLLQAEAARLDWRWGDLWRWWARDQPLRVQALTAQTLDLQLLRLADGRASWALGRGGDGESAAGEPAPRPQFGRLQVDAGHVRLDDAPLQTQLDIRLSGGEGDGRGAPADSPAPGGYRADITGRWQRLPLALAVRMQGALLLLDDDTAEPVQLRVEGRAGAAQLLFDGQAASLLSARRLDGALRFSGPSLAAVGQPLGVTLPRTPAFQLQGRLAHDDGVWGLRADSAVIGQSELGGEFRFDTRAQPRRLSGRLTGRRLLLADLGPAVGTRGEGRGSTAEPAPAPEPGRVLPQRRFDLPSLRVMDADVEVAIESLDLGSRSLAPLRAVRSRVLLQGGVLQLQNLQAGVAGGQVAGSTTLDGRGEPARWELALRVSGLDMAGWVRAFRAPGAAPPPGDGAALRRERRNTRARGQQDGPQPVQSYLTGVLGGQFNLRGQGRSTAQILGSLQGSAALQLKEGTISHLVTEAAGVDLAQALGVLVRGDAPLALRCARVDMVVREGVAVVQRGVLDNSDSTLRLDGQVDLRNEALALRARVRPKDFSLFAVRAPVLVTGSLGRPQVGLDGRALSKRAAAAAALAVIAAPVAALLPFVDPGDDPEGDPCG